VLIQARDELSVPHPGGEWCEVDAAETAAPAGARELDRAQVQAATVETQGAVLVGNQVEDRVTEAECGVTVGGHALVLADALDRPAQSPSVRDSREPVRDVAQELDLRREVRPAGLYISALGVEAELGLARSEHAGISQGREPLEPRAARRSCRIGGVLSHPVPPGLNSWPDRWSRSTRR
jgi:hypothetical protein